MPESQKTKWLLEWEALDTDRSFGNWMIEKAEALEAEVEDWEQSFNLYDDACRRGTKLWQEEGKYLEDPRVWPDTANLVAWLIEHLVAAEGREYAENSGRIHAEGRIDFAKLEIWKLVYPYISEDNIAYTEENMETLCEDVLPKIYDSILNAQQSRVEEGDDADREAQPAD